MEKQSQTANIEQAQMPGGNLSVMEGKQQTVAVHQPQKDMLSIIDTMIANPNFDVDKMMKLLEMQERIMAKNAEIAFNSALVRLSGDLPRIVRSKSVAYDIEKGNPKAGKKEAFKFAAYEDIDAELRPLLAREGFHPSFDMQPRADGGGATVTCTLLHVDGHSMKNSVVVALDTSGGKNNIQAMGSTISYAQRYCLKMMLNIVTVGEDDDGRTSQVITADQSEQIKSLLTESGADEKKFLEFAGADKIENISPASFDKSLNMLQAKAKFAKKGATEITEQPKTEKKA